MITGQKLSLVGNDDFESPSFYRSVTSALQYGTLTRPEIAYSINNVRQLMKCPKQEHWKAVRILKYLSGTLNHGLHIKLTANLNLTAF